MALTGYMQSSLGRRGGIRLLSFVEASAVTEVVYDAATDSFSSVILADGASWADYEFQEDGASLVERTTVAGNSITVVHELSLILPRMDDNSGRALRSLLEASPTGLIAVVGTNGGDSLLVGYSLEFGSERPLRVNSAVSRSGQKPSDGAGRTVVLVSTDTAPARMFSGRL